MAATEPMTARSNDVEFCTLGMFILGMLAYLSQDPANGILNGLSAQMTLTSVARDPPSRTFWAVQHRLQL